MKRTPTAVLARALPALLLAASAFLGGSGAGAQSRAPRFEPGSCAFRLPQGQVAGRTVRCGFVVVPERRDRPDGRRLRLAVAVLKSPAARSLRDPIIYLNGGPGGRSQPVMDMMKGWFFEDFAGRRDVIVYDQRGIGASTPTLSCPDLEPQESGPLPPQEEAQRYVEDALACRDRLEARGVDLGAYGTAESAADVDDIRRALGYDTLNLYGSSYGTLLAQRVMRDLPRSVRSVVLDAVVAPEASFVVGLSANVSRSLRGVFTACAADARCAAEHPDLAGRFSRLAARLDAEPLSFRAGGETMSVTGSTLVEALALMLYATDAIPLVPRLVDDVERGDLLLLRALIGAGGEVSASVDTGVQLSVLCRDIVPRGRLEAVAAANLGALPAVRRAIAPSQEAFFGVCERWGTVPDSSSRRAVVSAIPTLILSGALDPVTPTSYARAVARGLSRATLVEFPGGGHGQVAPTASGECAVAIMAAFLAEPARRLDASCAARFPLKFGSVR